MDAVVTAVKAKNKDFKVLCQGGADAIRKAATESTTALAKAGKLEGNPAQVGGAAGQKLGAECRGESAHFCIHNKKAGPHWRSGFLNSTRRFK